MIEQTVAIASRHGAMQTFPTPPERWCCDKLVAGRHWERWIALYPRRLG